jgi:hypothetical protein
MLISRNHAIMGEHRNGRISTTLGWATVALMSLAAAAALLYTTLAG